MGYSTDFVGCFKFSRTLSREEREYLAKFSDTRRMKRNPKIAATMGDAERLAVGIMDIGVEGGYFTGGLGFAGQGHDESILDHNEPPAGQPGLWCKWEPSACGNYLGWSGAEKFYDYVEWLQYLIDHFFTKFGVTITGVVRWRGEDDADYGSIVVTENKVEVKRGEKVRMTHGKKMERDSCVNWSSPPKKARA